MLPSADENDCALRDAAGTGEGYLYRYRDLAGEHADWVCEIIQASILYFSSPANFNDPFDCRARFRSDISRSEFKDRTNSLMAERGMSRNERRKAVNAPRSLKAFASNVARGMQEEIDRVGVLSLSSTHENILMWSHYACGHRGVCLQFRVTTDPELFVGSLPVTYSEELPTPTLFGKDHRERVEAILLTKAIDWGYEREWRVLDPVSGPGHRHFDAL